MRLKSFKNCIGRNSYILITGTNLSKQRINDLINIFDATLLMVSVTALDLESDFVKQILKKVDKFKIKLPSSNTITSKTHIVTELNCLLSCWNKLITSDPRSITIYGFDEDKYYNSSINLQSFATIKDYMINASEDHSFVIDAILEENMLIISFDKKRFNYNETLNLIKRTFV